MQEKDVVKVLKVAVSESHLAGYPLLAPDPYPHKLNLSFSIPHDLPVSIDGDEGSSLDYRLISDTLLKLCRRKEKFQGTEELAEELCRAAFVAFDAIKEIVVTIEKDRFRDGDHQEPNVGLRAERTRHSYSGEDTVFIKGLSLEVIAGLHEWERMERTNIVVDVDLICNPWKGGGGLDLPGLVASLKKSVMDADVLGLESLAASIAQTALSYGRQHPSKQARVKITKANAIPLSESVEVEVTRTPEYFARPPPQALAPTVSNKRVPRMTHKPKSASASSLSVKHTVVVAIGSNTGDRCANIEQALRHMEARHEIITISSTSFLYESDPMYVLDQPKFLNCAITAETTLRPLDLLSLLKHIEDVVGRKKSVRNGPRALDLDIIFYDTIIYDNRKSSGDGSGVGELIIPHPRLTEREFVLRPLNDIIPDYVHPALKTTVSTLHTALLTSNASTLRKVLLFPPPLKSEIPPVLWPLSSQTYIMAAINATPDSFSSTNPSTTDLAVEEGLAAVEAGANMIDVGGYSTRPGAAEVSPDEELRRVIPVIRRLREHGITLPISVDTFRPSVLRAAVAAGANCLNDVTALAGEVENHPSDESMALAVRELGVPIIMMHSRGAHDAGKNNDYSPQGGVVEGVRVELGARMTHALRCGIRRWHLIADPGFGFSKTTEGNIELLRRFEEVTASGALTGFPTLAGLSRKTFLGKVLDRETSPQEREWATGAGVAAAVQQGADIVRVHRVAEMRDITKVADKLWRITSLRR
ncbi:Dihydropteroate synthase [Hysterangium stoloniferum]|nr:Dihydropteroate synthase [Hysterangium stoloniferum]